MQDYKDAEFALFKMLGGEKGSPPKRWQLTTPGADVDGAQAVGVNLNSDDLVLDVDPRRYAEGENQLEQLWNKLQLPKPLDTYIVGTPSGGLHIYFKRPVSPQEVKRVHATVPGYPAIECKSKGRYILAAGSRTTRGVYTVKRGSPKRILQAPDALLALVEKPESTVALLPGGVQSDDTDTRRRFIRYMTDKPAAALGRRNDTIFEVACEGRDYGLPQPILMELIHQYNNRCAPPLSELELESVVHSVYRNAKNAPGVRNPDNHYNNIAGDPVIGAAEADFEDGVLIERITRGVNANEPKINLRNAVMYMIARPAIGRPNPLYNALAYNEFTSDIEIVQSLPWRNDHPQWTDYDTIELKYYMNKVNRVDFSTPMLEEAIQMVAKRQRFHPIKEWLESIEWDGVERLDTWLHVYCGSPLTKYISEIGKCFMIGAVARVYTPGCQHDTMLVLEGPQGSGKSTVARILGGKWYADILIDPHAKDTVVNMEDAWICEASEMEFLRGKDASALKRFLTLVTDKIRKPYARNSVKLPRKTVFLGTVNPDVNGYLVDTTGNRRFHPAVTYGINLEALERDRDQLFAEALVRFRRREPHHITDPEVIEFAKAEQAARCMREPWEDVVLAWMDRNKDDLPEMMTNADVAATILGLGHANLGMFETRRLSRAMEGAGWYRYRDRVNGKKAVVWRNDRYTEGL